MERWLVDMIKALTVGKWERDENIYVARIGDIKFKYLPDCNPTQLVIRKRVPATKDSRELWPSIKFFLVDGEAWDSFIKKDAVRNLTDDICAEPDKYFALNNITDEDRVAIWGHFWKCVEESEGGV